MAARIRKQVADEVTDEGAEQEPTPSDAPPPAPPPAPARRTRRQALATDGWAGAQPRARLTRTPLNVGMPDVLRIHERLALLTAKERITAQDAVAEAVDQWLTEKGYPR